MDIKTFLNEIGTVANAPGGIQHLREMILQLAVSGHLITNGIVNNEIEIELTEALLFKNEYEKKMGLRSSKPVSKIQPSDFPYSIPSHWKWERLDNIACYIQRGKSPIYDSSGSTFIVSQKCIQATGFNLSVAKKLREDYLEKYGEERFLQPKDLLWNSTGTGTVGRVIIYDETIKAVSDSHVTVIRLSNFNKKYIWCVLSSPWVQSRMDPSHESSLVSGTTNQVELSTSVIKSLPIPCPPVYEQKQIAAKVDELMALCDRLEALQQKRYLLSKQTRTIALSTLGNVTSSKGLKKSWNRVQDNMSFLFNNPQEVDEFRSSVMNLAIRGFLNKKSKDDAALLLDKCKKHTETQIFEKKKKTIKPVKHIKHPFKLPDNWVWTRFSEIGLFERGKSKHRPRNDPKLFKEGKYPFIQTGDVARATGKGIKDFHKQYGEFGLEQSKLWPKDTLCITIAANIADSAILKIDACFPDSVVGFIPYEFVDCIEYFDLFVRTAKSGLIDFAPSTAQKNINLGILEQVVIPLPPKKEMEEIIQFTNHIFSLCDKLQQQLIQRDITSERFVSYYVSAITGNTQPKEKEIMKTPKTELVSVLKLDQTPQKKDQAPLATILAKQKGELSAKSLWSYSGLTIDRFYRQLKTEMANGWIVEPQKAYIRETEAD